MRSTVGAWRCCASADPSRPARSAPVLRQRVSDALETGVTFDEVVGSLLALAPMIGTERLAAIAAELARALDYDIDQALERLD